MNFIENESAQKLRGGYYTPSDLAAFLVEWVKEIHPQNILEPSCGDGVFFQELAKKSQFHATKILGFEIEADEAKKAKTRAVENGLKSTRVLNEDFLNWSINTFETKTKFDAVLGNPPFVRYQYLPKEFQLNAEKIFKILELPFTKHTNAWVPFILASMKILRPGGRLAMVVPSEIIHVMHAKSLRTYLGKECSRLLIVDPEELWFDKTLQGAVILLAEKKNNIFDKSEGVAIHPVKGRDFLKTNPSYIFKNSNPINGKTVEGKWTRALLDKRTRILLDEIEEHENIHAFDKIAKVDVGIVTGANKFFLVPNSVVEEFGLKKWARPMFGRSGHCPGIIYDDQQHAENQEKGHPTNFIWFNEKESEIDNFAKKYIRFGEKQDLHKRYKCRIRAPWYTVPSVYSTEIGMLKRSHNSPRLILNNIGAYTTDTAYRIRSNFTTANKLVGCFVNPLTALSAELEGRHYGGGVLELVPSEIERLLIPIPDKVDIDLPKLDKYIRNLSMDDVLAKQGELILGSMGFSKEKQECITSNWSKLRNRRQRIPT